MKTSDLVVKCLENEEVQYVFGVPGEENEDLLFSLDSSDIKFIPTRHELGAAFMANVYGRLTGRAGVCLSTLGPGATNLVTGVADAHMDKVPLVAITGQGSLSRLHKESHQVIDVVGMFKPITKWTTSIHYPPATTEVVRKAFALAEVEKPGSTHIELPEDVAKMDVPSEMSKPIERRQVRRSGPDHKAVAEAMGVLKKAKRPLIIAGNGAIRKRASTQLRTLVAEVGIPVISTYMGKGAISDDDPRSLMTFGFRDRDYAHCAIDAADVLITIGFDVAEHYPDSWQRAGAKKIIHIDFTPAETYAKHNPDVQIVGDVAATLTEIHEQVTATSMSFDAKWYSPVRQAIMDDISSYDLKDDDALTVPGSLNVIREVVPSNGIILSDVGSHKVWIGRNYKVFEPNTCLISNGLATMGIALPGGIAARLAIPDAPVVAISGDGGFMMNSQELETAKRIGVGFTAIVFNDNDYGLINWKQTEHQGRSVGTTLTNPDFVKYAESFGINGYRASTPGELRRVLKKTVASNELAVVEVPVDPKVNLELNKKLDKLDCKKLTKLS